MPKEPKPTLERGVRLDPPSVWWRLLAWFIKSKIRKAILLALGSVALLLIQCGEDIDYLLGSSKMPAALTKLVRGNPSSVKLVMERVYLKHPKLPQIAIDLALTPIVALEQRIVVVCEAIFDRGNGVDYSKRFYLHARELPGRVIPAGVTQRMTAVLDRVRHEGVGVVNGRVADGMNGTKRFECKVTHAK